MGNWKYPRLSFALYLETGVSKEYQMPNLAEMSLMRCYWMLQNARVAVFAVSELLRENQQGGGKITPHPQNRVKYLNALQSYCWFTLVILFENDSSNIFDEIFCSYQSKHQKHLRKFMKTCAKFYFLGKYFIRKGCSQLKLTRY